LFGSTGFTASATDGCAAASDGWTDGAAAAFDGCGRAVSAPRRIATCLSGLRSGAGSFSPAGI